MGVMYGMPPVDIEDEMRRHGLPLEDEPIPMLLWCPSCGERHIDSDEWAKKPHHTHACQECGMVWRPAVVHTVGVMFLPGFRNADAVEQKGEDK